MKHTFNLIIIPFFVLCIGSCKDPEVIPVPSFEFDGEQGVRIDTSSTASQFVIITDFPLNPLTEGARFWQTLSIEKCRIALNVRINFNGRTTMRNYFYYEQNESHGFNDTGFLTITELGKNTISGIFETGNVKGSFSNIPFKNHKVAPCPASNDPSVYDGDVFLMNQEQANEFGKKGYKEINGNLIIGGYRDSSPQDVSPLYNLTRIRGNLEVFRVYSLSAFSGLEYVGGSIHIFGSKEKNLSFLSNLDSINGDLTFQNNYNLTDYCTLSHLLTTNVFKGAYLAWQNGYDPTLKDLKSGNCSK